MSIALPAADVRNDGPLAHGSRGSARAAALEQLPLRSGDLRGLQASRRGTGCVTAWYGPSAHTSTKGIGPLGYLIILFNLVV